MVIVHIAAIPQEKEQRCIRCCRKLIDIDPATRESFRPLAFVAVLEGGKLDIQETDADIMHDQYRCTASGKKK